MSGVSENSYSLSCFNCDEHPPEADSYQKAEELAFHAGFQLGLLEDANAYYACPDCAPLLMSATPAWPNHWTDWQRATTRATGGAA